MKQTISIVMATYNGSRYIGQQLSSFVDQTILPDQLVVIDDCSTDNTIEIIENFRNTATFKVEVIRNPKNVGSKFEYGFAQNFSQALGKATGDIVFLSDQDDVWFPEKLEKHLAIYKQNPTIAMIANNAIRTYSNLKHYNFTQLDYGKMAGNPTINIGCCFSFKKSFLDIFLPIPASFAHDIWLINCEKYLNIRCDIEEPLQYFRRTETSWSALNENSDFVTPMETYVARCKRLINYFYNRKKHSEILQQEIKLLRLIIKRYEKCIQDGCNNICSVISVSKAKKFLCLLLQRNKIQNTVKTLSRFKRVLLLKKSNDNYNLKSMCRDLLAKK